MRFISKWSIVTVIGSFLLTACSGGDDTAGGETEAGSNSAGSETSGMAAGEGSTGVSTGEDGASSKGASADASSSASSSGGSDGPAELHALVGHVHRDEGAAIAEGNDGIGTLYVGAFSGCEATAALAGFAVVANADVSDPSLVVDFTIMNLANGTYDVRVFLDDDGNANAAAPSPSPGDLVVDVDVSDGMATCAPNEVSGSDLEIDLALSATIGAR